MRTAILLGAGASASEGAPIQSQLFFKYFKSIKENIFYSQSEMDRELSKFFLEMFDINVNSSFEELKLINFPTFEEALGLLDLAVTRKQSFKGYSNMDFIPNSGRIERIRLYLSFLMGKSIQNNLYKIKGIHKRLIQNLRSHDFLSNTTFISTNYDILIDNALLENDGNINYGFEFNSYYNHIPEINWRHVQIPKLYKIHGSLNWLYCPTCNDVTITPGEKGLMRLLGDNLNDALCPGCHSVYAPMIVPPTYYKDFSNVFLNMVWTKAEQDLLKTGHIIICGYSFPEADMHIKYLLKRIQKNRCNSQIRFTIINNHEGKKEVENREEKDRYERFLGPINYTNLSFEEFAANPGEILR